MDCHNFPLFSLILAFILMLVVMKKVRKGSKTKNTNSKLPPGPGKLPLIGNLHQLLGLPHHSLKDLAKKYGPLMHVQLGEISAIVVSSPEKAKLFLKTNDLSFADRGESHATEIMTYNYTDVGFSPYGEYWRQLKKIFVVELLSTKRVQSFKSVREEEVTNVIQSISLVARSQMNLSDKIYALTNDITARAAFGKKCKDKIAFISAMKEATRMANGFAIEDLFPSLKLHVISGIRSKLERLHHKVDRILDSILKYHRENRMLIKTDMAGDLEEDLVDVLLRLQESGGLEFPFTLDNIKAVIFDIFTAGTEASSTTIEWVMSELVKNPRVMKKAQEEVRQILNREVDETKIHELKYLKLVIKETLRLHPSLPLILPRECRESCEIDGYEIPKKTKVIVNVWAMGRDPEHWSDAESFEPERFNDCSLDYKGANFEYIPFGAGRRMCPGIGFGIAVVELLLAQLLYHFDWKLPNKIEPRDLDMSERFGMTVKRVNDLYLIPIPYSPLSTE